jgi:diguanylate cyclase (GGDEF)-like protein
MRMFKFKVSKARSDAAILLVLFWIAYWYAVTNDVFEHLIEFMESHESWQLDELVTSVMLVGVCGFVFAWRRYLETRHELSRREAAEASVSWLAHYDALTELPNRRMLNDFVREFDALVAGKHCKGSYAVYSIDLDGFKKINDLYGHAAGDQLLKIVAERLRSLFPDDLAVRLGGDEFVVVAKTSGKADAHETGARVLQAVGAPMRIDGIHVEVGASIGIVIHPMQATSLEAAIRHADIAMYAAKRSASNRVVLFKETMTEAVKKRADLEQALRDALAVDAIEPHYQPLFNLQTDRIYGFEVLARWTLPNGTSIPPGDFIAVAEEAGLISDLSEKLLRKACLDAKAWPEDIMLSFNLSPTQLADSLIGLRLVSVLDETRFHPQRLEIEVTESAMIMDSESAHFVIQDLRSLGIQIAIDDFGTGYSNLSQIARFSFSRLKIDQGFIREFEEDPKQRCIVKAIISLGNDLNVATTAEGIEKPSQLEALKQLGCTCGQGYLLGRPMTAEMATRTLAGTDRPVLSRTG